ncbi:hypothetical protein [Methylophilus sp. Leaf414]|uniref:hypothetical protein n=1 Tax=Methylophilus sp. Leaf414 TaxID=1736371 RepID=UPI000A92280F|nr:hypothetical protein [Methylophilus sp. Leaf414]
MAQANLSNDPLVGRNTTLTSVDTTNRSAISWAAILLGAVAAAALSLILFILGTGLGLSSISPWSHDGVTAATFGIAAIIWITVTQALASGLGGYLTGRLRVRWQDTDPDEVYFRDTAHGFIAWGVATLLTAALLTSVIGSIVSTGVQATASVAGGAATAGVVAAAHSGISKDAGDQASGASAYFVDALFRPAPANTATDSADHDPSSNAAHHHAAMTVPQQDAVPSAEVSRIIATSIANGALSAEDSTYLAQLVSQHTGLTQQEAEARVNQIYTTVQDKAKEVEVKTKEAADAARKASVGISLWLFVSLLIGAFSASLAATWGGRCRDA